MEKVFVFLGVFTLLTASDAMAESGNQTDPSMSSPHKRLILEESNVFDDPTSGRSWGTY